MQIFASTNVWVRHETLESHALPGDAAAFAVEQLGIPLDPTQAALLARGGHRVILNCTRQWGKSSIGAARAIWQAVRKPRSLTVVVTPSARQSGEFLMKVRQYAQKLALPVRGDGNNEISLLLPNGSRIVGLPERPSTIRGFTAVSLMIVDEAAQVSDDVFQTVLPMLAVANGDLWMLSTPFGRRGFFHQEWVSQRPWDRVTARATECPWIPPEFLEEMRERSTPSWFGQEYLCEFHDTEDSLFHMPAIEAAFRADLMELEF